VQCRQERAWQRDRSAEGESGVGGGRGERQGSLGVKHLLLGGGVDGRGGADGPVQRIQDDRAVVVLFLYPMNFFIKSTKLLLSFCPVTSALLHSLMEDRDALKISNTACAIWCSFVMQDHTAFLILRDRS
jgi:hypothetical protein